MPRDNEHNASAVEVITPNSPRYAGEAERYFTRAYFKSLEDRIGAAPSEGEIEDARKLIQDHRHCFCVEGGQEAEEAVFDLLEELVQCRPAQSFLQKFCALNQPVVIRFYSGGARWFVSERDGKEMPEILLNDGSFDFYSTSITRDRILAVLKLPNAVWLFHELLHVFHYYKPDQQNVVRRLMYYSRLADFRQESSNWKWHKTGGGFMGSLLDWTLNSVVPAPPSLVSEALDNPEEQRTIVGKRLNKSGITDESEAGLLLACGVGAIRHRHKSLPVNAGEELKSIHWIMLYAGLPIVEEMLRAGDIQINNSYDVVHLAADFYPLHISVRPLSAAAFKGAWDNVACILELAEDLQVSYFDDSITPLLYAAQKRPDTVAKTIIQHPTFDPLKTNLVLDAFDRFSSADFQEAHQIDSEFDDWWAIEKGANAKALPGVTQFFECLADLGERIGDRFFAAILNNEVLVLDEGVQFAIELEALRKHLESVSGSLQKEYAQILYGVDLTRFVSRCAQRYLNTMEAPFRERLARAIGEWDGTGAMADAVHDIAKRFTNEEVPLSDLRPFLDSEVTIFSSAYYELLKIVGMEDAQGLAMFLQKHWTPVNVLAAFYEELSKTA